MLIIQRPSVEIVSEEEANRQRFAIGPLEPGFGHTLGNALRRTLLSSIPGAGVTQVRFDDALHEFTTLPGVKEDVTDIILNLKDIVLQVESDESVTLRLDVRGPATVTAGDRREQGAPEGVPEGVTEPRLERADGEPLAVAGGLLEGLDGGALHDQHLRSSGRRWGDYLE